MEDNFLLYQLFSVYGELLTQNQRETIEDYFGLDLSLGEIAEMRGVSRQAIKYTLDNAEKALKEYENKLGFLKKLSQIKNLECNDNSFKQSVIKILEDR
ncbi:MAG: DNA-binding protein [Clostridia bacterium]|nr:DNA-binding protein [Clostridia bacterium]